MTDAQEPAPSDDEAPGASVPRELPTGWVQLSATTLRERLAVPGNVGFFAAMLLIDLFQVVSILVRPGAQVTLQSVVVSLGVTLLITVAVILIALPFVAPIAEANYDLGQLRWRRRSVPFAEIAVANLAAARNGNPGPVLALTLSIGPAAGLKVTFVLTAGDRVVLDVRRRTLLAEVIRRSKIDYPKDPYDPKGKFARYNFPGALTRDEALDIVLHPPAPGDPLPIAD